jgi:hypothetical protein
MAFLYCIGGMLRRKEKPAGEAPSVEGSALKIHARHKLLSRPKSAAVDALVDGSAVKITLADPSALSS